MQEGYKIISLIVICMLILPYIINNNGYNKLNFRDKLNFITNILILMKLGCCLEVIYRTDFCVCYRMPSLAMYRQST